MQKYATLVRSHPNSAFDQRQQILEVHREAVAAQIQQLQDNLAVIDWKIQHYSTLQNPVQNPIQN